VAGLNELQKASRAARKSVEEAEAKYARRWEILLDAKNRHEKNPQSSEAQAAHAEAIQELNKNRHTNDRLITEWIRLKAEAREARKGRVNETPKEKATAE
jgi:hypothetical protein